MHIDFLLAYYCAPTLKGLKPANLILHNTFTTLDSLLAYDDAKRDLDKLGIEMHRVWTCPEKSLTLVYNREKLKKHLSEPSNMKFLKKMGYESHMGLDVMIDKLSGRMALGNAFPHEVGIFLGYPLVDVLGFIENNGQNCKFCGYWKVYGDEIAARNLFNTFTSVREGLLSQLQSGVRLKEILHEAS